jgi:hypothetical protein
VKPSDLEREAGRTVNAFLQAQASWSVLSLGSRGAELLEQVRALARCLPHHESYPFWERELRLRDRSGDKTSSTPPPWPARLRKARSAPRA